MASRKSDTHNFPASAECARHRAANTRPVEDVVCRPSSGTARPAPVPSPDARTSAAFYSLLVHTKESKTRSQNEFLYPAARGRLSRDNKKLRPAKSGPCNKVHGPTAASSASYDPRSARECSRCLGSRPAVAPPSHLSRCFPPSRAKPDDRRTAAQTRSLPTIYKCRNPNRPVRAAAHRSSQSTDGNYPFAHLIRAPSPSTECSYSHSPRAGSTQTLPESSQHGPARSSISRTANAQGLERLDPSIRDRTKAPLRSGNSTARKDSLAGWKVPRWMRRRKRIDGA